MCSVLTEQKEDIEKITNILIRKVKISSYCYYGCGIEEYLQNILDKFPIRQNLVC